ncbi:MAG: hypothetical protein KBC05_04135 [Candidatus Hydrogenedentes bacterium]|nr:hypothetical protein [Candidatus Hydrogenedentota bacterium]
MSKQWKQRFLGVARRGGLTLVVGLALLLLPARTSGQALNGSTLLIQKTIGTNQHEEIARVRGLNNPGAGSTRITVTTDNGLGAANAKFLMAAYGTGFTGTNTYLNNAAGLFAFGSLFFTGGTANVPLMLFANNKYQVPGHLYIDLSGNVGIGVIPTVKLDVNGEAKVKVLQITGGSDLSESFQVQPVSDVRPQPGMVVCIDPARPGELRISASPNDTTVAGIISGAGGINPGMVMGQQDSVAFGGYPVALTGRVYCLADATAEAIAPGDLLTTSTTPGHAMKVTDYAGAQGAVIGKAMTPLAAGEKGLVLVLVTLQ